MRDSNLLGYQFSPVENLTHWLCVGLKWREQAVQISPDLYKQKVLIIVRIVLLSIWHLALVLRAENPHIVNLNHNFIYSE